MASTKRVKPRASSDRPSKSAYIREHPTLSAPQLVKQGAAQGLKFTAGLVHVVRSRAKATALEASDAAGVAERNFVCQQFAMGKSVRETIAAAAAAGMKLSASRAVAIRRRSVDALVSPETEGRGSLFASSSRDLARFKRLALQVGLRNARQCLEELEHALVSLAEHTEHVARRH